MEMVLLQFLAYNRHPMEQGATYFIITDAHCSLINDHGKPQMTRSNIIIVTSQVNHFSCPWKQLQPKAVAH